MSCLGVLRQSLATALIGGTTLCAASSASAHGALHIVRGSDKVLPRPAALRALPRLTAGAGDGAGSCAISTDATAVSFGTIGAIDPQSSIASALFTVSCFGSVTASAELCDGQAGPGGTFTLRDGPSSINFNIEYQNAAAASAKLDDCAISSMPLSAAPDSQTYRLVATIPPAHRPLPPGTYTDTVTLTVIY